MWTTESTRDRPGPPLPTSVTRPRRRSELSSHLFAPGPGIRPAARHLLKRTIGDLAVEGNPVDGQVLFFTTPALGTRFRSNRAYASARSRTPAGLLPTLAAALMMASRTASRACSLALWSTMVDDATRELHAKRPVSRHSLAPLTADALADRGTPTRAGQISGVAKGVIPRACDQICDQDTARAAGMGRPR